jgi:hypothetical protein
MIRIPPPPREGESRQQWETWALRPWRMDVKMALLAQRGWKCERCGSTVRPFDLDEGIVPRCDMGGLSLDQRRMAFAEVNLFIVCARCNRYEAHDRDGAFRRACTRYGESVVRSWYASLGLKAPRADWLPKEE